MAKSNGATGATSATYTIFNTGHCNLCVDCSAEYTCQTWNCISDTAAHLHIMERKSNKRQNKDNNTHTHTHKMQSRVITIITKWINNCYCDPRTWKYLVSPEAGTVKTITTYFLNQLINTCIYINHLKLFHFWFTVSAPQMCCIKWSTMCSKKSYFNIICNHVPFTPVNTLHHHHHRRDYSGWCDLQL